MSQQRRLWQLRVASAFPLIQLVLDQIAWSLALKLYRRCEANGNRGQEVVIPVTQRPPWTS